MPIKNQYEPVDLDSSILITIDAKKPQNIEELIKLMCEKTNFSENRIMESILLLQEKGKIKLEDDKPFYSTLIGYVFSPYSYWYLFIVILTIFTNILVIGNFENLPILGNYLIYVRYIFGGFFVIFIPGYSFVKAIFGEKKINNSELFALSIGVSLCLVAFTFFLLNFSPWRISAISITFGLSVLILFSSTIAVNREYQNSKKKISTLRQN